MSLCSLHHSNVDLGAQLFTCVWGGGGETQLWVFMHVCAHECGVQEVLSGVQHPTFLEDRVSHWPGTHQVG